MKQFVGRACAVFACICVCLGILQYYFFFFIGACLFCIASGLKFPFREEEAWECSCGYDLSFMNPTAKKCPECGKETELEWTSTPGEFCTKTTKRLHWAVWQFAFALVALAAYIAHWLYYSAE